MRVELDEIARDDAIVTLRGVLPPLAEPYELWYRTRTGALLSVADRVAGAYDREHDCVRLEPADVARPIVLAVERQSLPTHGLPAGDGLRWRWMLARARAEPEQRAELRPCADDLPPMPAQPGVALWGHSHLDVAWLWTYAEAARKAQRTFANALELGRRDPAFRFSQSQPQLYAFVERDAPELFTEVCAAVAERRWDAGVAALWVEADCNIPSGESLLRQMLFAHRFCAGRFGVAPSIAWLPDSFGFPNTLPALLAHAGITRFATTKLFWNDTTPFPLARWRWRAPDGSSVTAALISGMDGALTPARAARARQRAEPVLVGYGDGGGGPTRADLRSARTGARWETADRFFERLERSPLDDYCGELYLQYHRGTYTTHHDVKAENAWCERALRELEEGLAWALAVRARPEVVARLCDVVRAAWEIVLRNQFHDVLPGTCVAAAYTEVFAEYAQAREGIELVRNALSAMLPRAAAPRARRTCEPRHEDGAWAFDNGMMGARVLDDGTLVSLGGVAKLGAVTKGNLLALYADRPKRWDAWNVDRSYRRRRMGLRPAAAAVENGALTVPFSSKRSRARMRISLGENEPFLRVALDVSWHERHALLRVENWLCAGDGSVTFGSPHGTVVRDVRSDTPEARAQFEVPGQRYALVRDANGDGMALFARDTYGWSARALRGGGTALGHSLLRAPVWPDPSADLGDATIEWAFAPLTGASLAMIERAWERFADVSHVRLFTCDDDAVLVTACKPAEDGRGIIVRVRECDGRSRRMRLRCGARMMSVESVDALERPVEGAPRIEGEELIDDVPAFALRSYRVRFPSRG